MKANERFTSTNERFFLYKILEGRNCHILPNNGQFCKQGRYVINCAKNYYSNKYEQLRYQESLKKSYRCRSDIYYKKTDSVLHIGKHNRYC